MIVLLKNRVLTRMIGSVADAFAEIVAPRPAAAFAVFPPRTFRSALHPVGAIRLCLDLEGYSVDVAVILTR